MQQPNNRRFCGSSPNRELEPNLSVELRERISRLDVERQMLQQELNELRSNLFLTASSPSNPSPRQFLNSEPLPTRRVNSPVTPPHSPLAAATTGINVNSSPREEISSPRYGRYHDHDNLARPHPYQRFSPSRPIDELRGNVVTAAKNQHGSRVLQDKLRHEHPENIDMIFSEMKESLWSLMVHLFGYPVVQKLIDVVDDNKLVEILDLLTRDVSRLEELCAHDHGTKVVQKLVGRLRTPEQQFFFASFLSQIALSLTKSTNGSAVISQRLTNFSPSHRKLLLRPVAMYCNDIAQDKNGCCILQKCFTAADREIFNMLAAAIILNADTLSKNCNGNYVVQFVINMKNLEVNRRIAAKFRGKFVSISMNKYGSNVVEELLKDSGLEEQVADLVISEIMSSDSPLLVSQDTYGNFVVRTAIRVIREGQLLNHFIQHLEDNVRQLQCHMYGKRVLQAVNARQNRNG